MERMGFFIYGWGNMMNLSSWGPGKCDIFKRDKVDSIIDCGKDGNTIHELYEVSTAYHDRLRQWNEEKYTRACKKVGIHLNLIDANEDELDEFLTEYFGYPCRMFFTEVQRGMNGFDYVRMDFQYSSKDAKKG